MHKFDLECIVGESSVVEHRLTKEKLVKKTVSKTPNNKAALDLFRHEIDILKACRSLKSVVKIVDVVEETEQLSIILKYFEEKSLRELVELGAELDVLDVY